MSEFPAPRDPSPSEQLAGDASAARRERARGAAWATLPGSAAFGADGKPTPPAAPAREPDATRALTPEPDSESATPVPEPEPEPEADAAPKAVGGSAVEADAAPKVGSGPEVGVDAASVVEGEASAEIHGAPGGESVPFVDGAPHGGPDAHETPVEEDLPRRDADEPAVMGGMARRDADEPAVVGGLPRGEADEPAVGEDAFLLDGDEPDQEAAGQVELKTALEAILIVVDEPVNAMTLAQVLERPTHEVETALNELAAEYSGHGRGFDLREVAGGWRFYTRADCAPLVERFVRDGQQARLTQAALETLAVVAYRQPVSRARVAAVRGVNSDGVMRTLVARGLVEEAGTDPESQAVLYRTSSYFLERLGLKSLDELPELAPFLPDDVENLEETTK